MASKKPDGKPSEAPSSISPQSTNRSRASDSAPTFEGEWGRWRNALAAIANFDTLVRSTATTPEMLADMLPEFRDSCAVLKHAFSAANQVTIARDELAAYTLPRIDALEAAFTRAVAGDRETIRDDVMRLSLDIDAAAWLLELTERAQNPAPAELSLEALAHESLQMALAIRAQQHVPVRLQAVTKNATVHCDPQIAARILAIGVALAHTTGAKLVVMNASADDAQATIEVAPESDAPVTVSATVTMTKLLRTIDPTANVARACALAAGMSLEIEDSRITLRIPRV